MRVDKYTDALEAIELAITELDSSDETARDYLLKARNTLLRIRNEDWMMKKVEDIVGKKT